MQFRICRFCTYALFVLVLVMSYVPELAGQGAEGALRGQVTDPSGAVVPGATVVLKSPGARSVTTKSDGAGLYEIKGLLPGEYTVEVTAKGFKIFTADVQVSSGQIQHINAVLQISVQNQQVVVEGNPENSP